MMFKKLCVLVHIPILVAENKFLHSSPVHPFKCCKFEGPSTQYLRPLVPKLYSELLSEPEALRYCVLGPSRYQTIKHLGLKTIFGFWGLIP